jgi:hypothetical protein
MGAHLRGGAEGLKQSPSPRVETTKAASAPVFIVHSLAHAVAALTAAADADREVILASAPEAGIYAGPGWFAALIATARKAVPSARFSALLDCGDDAGAAQGAIRAGIDGLIFTGRADVAERLAAIAAARDCHVLTARPPTGHDLLSLLFADSETLRRHCADLLASPPPIC